MNNFWYRFVGGCIIGAMVFVIVLSVMSLMR